MDYDRGMPIAYRAMLTYNDESGIRPFHVYGGKAETQEEAWRLLWKECSLHLDAMKEVKQFIKSVQWNLKEKLSRN